MIQNFFIDSLKKNRIVSLIGLEKNVGKTTVLNCIIEAARGKLKLGLTSIGRDGEATDRVTKTHKPRIYVESGTLIATAKQCLFNGDITKEIIEATGINTPMGEVIIAKALSDGFIELGGPSINSQMAYVSRKLLQYGSEAVLIDGALSRKTTASPAMAQASILSTGAVLGRNMDSVIERTRAAVEILSIKQVEEALVLKKSEELLKQSSVGIIYKNGESCGLELLTALEEEKKVAAHLKTAEYVVIKGILSDKFLENIMKITNDYKGTTFIVEDSTKLFIKNETLKRFERKGGSIRVMHGIKLLCVTCNPKAPEGYEFDGDIFLKRLEEEICIPVFDIKAASRTGGA